MIARGSLLRTLISLCAVVGGLLSLSAPALAQRMHAFSKSFGSAGSGNGQLTGPGALAVNDSTGDVYVIDRGNGRVEVFSSTGAYMSQFNGSASSTGAFSWPSWPATCTVCTRPEDGSIAVDNSSNSHDPSKGDVYVVDYGHNVIDKFTASGTYIGQVVNSTLNIYTQTVGVAVDSNGGLWVQLGWFSESEIEKFNDASANEYVSKILVKPRLEEAGEFGAGIGVVGFALESEDNFYIGVRPGNLSKFTVPTKFSANAEVLAGRLDGEETTGLAVDLSSEDLYVDHETSVAAYSPSTASIERFGSAQMHASEGIAVDSASGTVYTSNASSQEIDVFTAFVVPDAVTGSASSFAETSVTVGGVVNPDGLPVTSCVFEYGTSTTYGQSEPCSPSPGSGSGPVTVSANLSGLERLTQYHFRLNVSNANGSNQGQDRTFVTPEPVVLSEASVSDVSSAGALFSVQVNPGGADTTYHFEYDTSPYTTSAPHGESVPVPDGDLGAGTTSVPAAVRAQDLLGETTYHVRVVASNVLGTVYGPDQVFTTQAGGGAFVLPDGRGWEMVSPPIKDGAGIGSIGGGGNDAGLIEASANGGAVSYVANAPLGANIAANSAPAGPTQVLSRRGAGGWSSEDITTPQKAVAEDSQDEYLFFSSDFLRALVEPHGALLLSREATEQTPYVRDNSNGVYLPLVTADNVEPPGTEFGPLRFPNANSEDPSVLAATPDLAHVLFSSPFALTSNAQKSIGSNNLYEWSGGRLQLVNVLPEGKQANGLDPLFKPHMISSDGSRVFFSQSSTGALYMRDTVTGHTVQVDAPAPGVSPPPDERAEFQTASADGSEVFFLDEQPLTLDSKLKPVEVGNTTHQSDLYVYDTVTGSLTDLSVDQNAGERASVQHLVVGASEDGSIVYFVANGVLTSTADGAGEHAVQGTCENGAPPSALCNLYVESKTGSTWSSPRLVAVLSNADNHDWNRETLSSTEESGGALTSRVSPGGRYLTFMSQERLKTSNFPNGYDNRDANSGQPDEELFLYDEATNGLRCVSCNPTGARPHGLFEQNAEEHYPLVDETGVWRGRWLAGSIPEWTREQALGGSNLAYQSRVLSDEGRMFFNSADALVPQDTNGREDVYEYEPQGVGSCARAGGCVSLISSGTSAEESAFLDASENGEDVFFLTAARLTPQDVDNSFDVYDAHVCSPASPCVSAPVSPPPCTSGDACKTAPSPQPELFGPAPSATFSGTGNVVESPKPSVKPKSKKCKQGFVRKKVKEKQQCVKAKSKKKAKKSIHGKGRA
jgi:NHL repeat